MQNNGKSAFGLDANVAAGLAYLPICLCHLIVSIAILVTDKTNKLARFHAIQSLLLSAFMFVAYIVAMVLVFAVMIIAGMLETPAVAILAFVVYAVLLLVVLAALVGLVISCIQAFQGRVFKLPLLGSLADKWSN